MHGLIVAAFALSLAGPLFGPAAPGGDHATTLAADEANTVSQLDVPSASFNRIEMAQPDRDPDRAVCRYETVPDSHLKKRNCAFRRDRQALETIEHQYLMTNQRGFCGGGALC